MKFYKLPFVMRSPSEDTEDKYLAEVPILPGCRAWGDTAAEALENLQSVATASIESYRLEDARFQQRLKPRPGMLSNSLNKLLT